LTKWAVTLAAFVALALPEVASAWSFSVSGSANCDAQTGEYVISWTVNNSSEPEALTITSSSRAAVSGSVAARSSAGFSERLPGTTSGAVSLTVSGSWPSEADGYTSSGSVSLSGDCESPPPPPPVSDVCPNIEGVQTSVPPGMIKDASGNCVAPPPPPPPMSDDCPNLPGIQGSVPEGMIKDENGDCVTRPTPPPPPADVCPNLAGVQAEVPSGMTKDASGNCVTPTLASAPTPQAAPTTTPTQPAAPVTTTPPVKSGVKSEVKTKRVKKAKAKAKVKAKTKRKVKKQRPGGGTLPITK
jgi:hypothetical protein